MIFEVLDDLDQVLRLGVIRVGYEALSSYIAAPLRSGMVLLVMAHGFKLFKGQAQGLTTVDVGWLVIKMGVVSELLINWTVFDDWIHSTVWGTYVELADVLAGTLIDSRSAMSELWGSDMPNTTVLSLNGDTLDAAFKAQLGSAVEQALGTPSFSEWASYTIKIPMPTGTGTFDSEVPVPIMLPNLISNVAGLIKVVMTVLLFASVFVVMLISRLGLTSCLAVAPIFIALALFQHTRSYTDSWLRGMLGFMLTPMLLVVALLVSDVAIQIFDAKQTSALSTPEQLIGSAITYLLLYYALAKSIASIPQFASGMVGSMLSHIGDGAAHQLIGTLHRGVDAGVGAAKGAAGGFIKGGPAGAKLGAAHGAAAAMR